MKTLYFLGSSHSQRLHQAFEKFITQNNQFKIVNLSQSGAVFNKTFLTFPKPESLTREDCIIIQTFGNDIFEKHLEKVFDPETRKNQIHLRKCVANPSSQITKLHQRLRDYVLKVPCRVFLVDCIYRYLCKTWCQIPQCQIQSHHYPKLLSIQSKHNKTLYKFFANIPNLTVIRHINCMPFSGRYLKKFSNYQHLLVDKVHLKEEYYKSIITTISSKLVGGLAGHTF